MENLFETTARGENAPPSPPSQGKPVSFSDSKRHQKELAPAAVSLGYGAVDLNDATLPSEMAEPSEDQQEV